MFRNLLSAALCYLLLVSSTCERPVELPFDLPEPRLVVLCNFTDGLLLQVQVSKSQSTIDPSPEEYISDAQVEIYEGDVFIETLELVLPGSGGRAPYYVTRMLKPVPDVLYTIKVHAPGFESVMAQSAIPKASEILAFSLSDVTVESVSGGNLRYNYNADISFGDPPGEQNFYHLNLYQQFLEYEVLEGDTFLIDSSLQVVFFNSSINTNALLAYFGGGILFEDDAFLSNRLSIPVAVQINPEYQIIGKVYAELRTVSEEYYRFHETLGRQQNNPGGGLSEPVIVFHNIENGHGIFAGYNTNTDSVFVRH